MTTHKELAGANIHVPYAFEYDDETAREAATGFVSADVGKFARQLDDNSFWVLTAVTPTWVAVGGSGSGGRVLIASATPSGTGTITFSSIPGTYVTLEIEMLGRSTKAASNLEDVAMEANGDTTAANYRYILDQGYGAGTTGAAGGDDRLIARLPAASSPANSAGACRIVIPHYTNTTFFKQAFAHASFRYDASSLHEIIASHGWEWENQNAITDLALKLASGNYVAGTIANLYGLI